MDAELNRRLAQIEEKLGRLVEGGETREAKKKMSTWKLVSIAVPVVVAAIGLVGTGWELTQKFLDNQSNRRTIGFYTALAQSLVEKGNYEAARDYLGYAEKLDPNNASVVSTKALIDMTTLVRRALDNPDVLTDVKYYLHQLTLSPDEINYHIGVVAADTGRFSVSRDYLRRVSARSPRLRLLARSRLLGHVYLANLNLPQSAFRVPVDTIFVELLTMPEELQRFRDDPELAENLREQLHIYATALSLELAPDQLVEMKDAFAGLSPRNEDFLTALDEQIAASRAPELESPAAQEKVIEHLYAAQKRLSPSSPVRQQLDRSIQQYSAEAALEDPSQAQVTQVELEKLRLEGVRQRRAKKLEDAEATFLRVVDAYRAQGLPKDETLYKTYFNLGLLYSFNFGDADKAILYYEMAEDLATGLQLKDPTIHNTFGYFYYELARATKNPTERKNYFGLAAEKLQAALNVDPNYAKSQRTLEAVRNELARIEQAESARQTASR